MAKLLTPANHNLPTPIIQALTEFNNAHLAVQHSLALVKNSLAENLTEEAVAVLYWRVPQISVIDMASILGCQQADIRKLAGSATVEVSCPACFENWQVTITSRSQLVEWSTGPRRPLDERRFYCHRCKEHESAQDEIRVRQWRKEEREQAERLLELRAMPYREYLQTPEWKAQRERTLRFAMYRCQVCNGNQKLNVHHRTYERRGNEYHRDLIVLCHNCHEIFHKEGKLAA